MLVKRNMLSLCSVLLLTLCNGCSNDSASTKVAAGVEVDSYQDSVATSAQGGKIRTDASHGKPGAQISLVNNQVYQLEPGIEADINIALFAPYSEGEMRISVTTSDGLAMLDGETHYSFNLGPSEEYAIPLRLLAPEAGRYYVSLHITVIQEGREIFKAISAIVQAGSESDRIKPSAQPEKTTPSDGVVSLPAVEDIIQE